MIRWMQVKSEKATGFRKTMDMFEFVRDVILRPNSWESKEGELVSLVKLRSDHIVSAFSPEMEKRAKDEQVGKLACVVQTILSRALGY